MARHEHLPIWRDAMKLATVIEGAVRAFPRYHKYVLGTDLRQKAQRILTQVVRANSTAGDGRVAAIDELLFVLEEMKTLLALAKEVQAFGSFAVFQQAAELAVALSKQSGGWRKQQRATSARSVAA